MWTRFNLAIYILLPCVQSVRICLSQNTGPQRNIYVEIDNVSGPCTCDITVSARISTGEYLPNTLQFERKSNNGGQCSEFKLVFKNNQSDKTWCGGDNFSITSDNYEMLKMTLEDDGSKHSFEFTISTEYHDNWVKIRCYKPTITTTGSPSSTTTTTSTTSTSMNTDSTPTTSDLSTSPPSGLVHSLFTDRSSTFTPRDDITTERNIRNREESQLSVILGCSIGGTVVILLVITITCVFFRRRNRQKNTSSDTDVNQTATISQHVYSSPDSVDDYVKDFHRYEHLPKQRERVQDTGIES